MTRHDFCEIVRLSFSFWKMGARLVLCVVIAIASSAQTYSTIVSFDGNSAANPTYVSLVQGVDGSLYGTTALAGTGNCHGGCGVVFKITRQGSFQIVHNFDGMDGVSPQDGLTLGDDGKFYGTTYQGTTSYGTAFSITSEGTLTTLHGFDMVDGANPIGGLLQGPDGNFYGTTFSGGTYNSGTIFKLTPSGTLTTLYNFCTLKSCVDGFWPMARLALGPDGKYYGTSANGGAYGYGTIFTITSQGKLTTLHSFGSGSDGISPESGLLLGVDGNFYGVTSEGTGGDGNGILYKTTLGGSYTFLNVFGVNNGFEPTCMLVQGTDGNLYGTTQRGGYSYYGGTVFEATPAGSITTLHSFSGFPSDGATPYGGLVQHTDGKFYGVTWAGGSYTPGYGTVFSLDTGLAPFVAFVRGYGRIGQNIGILGQGFVGTTSVSLNLTPATFTVVSDTFMKATVPASATTGYVAVTTPGGTLTSNALFRVIP